MEVAGLPLHPLVVHAVVVLLPLAVLSAVVQAVLPGWRWLTRWSTLLTSLAAFLALVVARQSGKSMLAARPFLLQAGSSTRDHVLLHQHRANLLTVAGAVFLVVVVAAFVLVPAPTGLAGGGMDHPGVSASWVRVALPVLLVVTALVVLVLVVLTGDAGARTVWGS